jgi:hypothetical protein
MATIHSSHLPSLRAWKANIKKAIFDGEQPTIGGGTFMTAELVSVLHAVEHAIDEIEKRGK